MHLFFLYCHVLEHPRQVPNATGHLSMCECPQKPKKDTTLAAHPDWPHGPPSETAWTGLHLTQEPQRWTWSKQHWNTDWPVFSMKLKQRQSIWLFTEQIYGFPKGMWFLSRFRLKCLISSRTMFIYTIFFLRILLVKVVFSNHHFQIWLFRADFQKERGFWVDLGLISSKTTLFLRILLVKMVFSNHHFQIWLFKADFEKERGFWVDLGLIPSTTTFLLRILLVKVVFSNHFLKSLFSNLTF